MKSFLSVNQNSNSPVTPALNMWPFTNNVPNQRESPVAIITPLLVDVALPQLQFFNHVDDDVDCIVKNTGHTGK